LVFLSERGTYDGCYGKALGGKYGRDEEEVEEEEEEDDEKDPAKACL